MKRAWRMVKERHAATAFDGEGAWLHGGRWNSPRTRLIYTSGSKALAALENLVHINPPVAFKYVAIPIDFDDAWVETIAASDLSANWTEEPAPPSTKAIGDWWTKQARSAVLEVPSVIVQSESNYLFNPAHPDFKKALLGRPEPFSFDRRLL